MTKDEFIERLSFEQEVRAKKRRKAAKYASDDYIKDQEYRDYLKGRKK